jgi:hypothetical protein
MLSKLCAMEFINVVDYYCKHPKNVSFAGKFFCKYNDDLL